MKKIKIHILVWVSYFLYTYVSDFILGQVPNIYVYTALFLTHNVFIFYSAAYCLSKSSFSTWVSSFKTILRFIVGFLSFAAIKLLYRIYLVPLLAPQFPKISNYFSLATETVQWYLYIFLYALGYHYMMTSTRKEKQLRKMAQLNQQEAERNHQLQTKNLALEIATLSLNRDKLRNEQQHLQIEYAFLRSQINPHFLHNTLNFFYSKSLSGNTQELSEAILILSEIMRYSLQKEETGTKEVPLADELEHIYNVIKINQLRFNNSLNIVFNTPANTENIHIIPLVLITLVENAFKHGDLNNPAFPLEINLEITENRQLKFMVINKKKTGPKELSNGIGINNIRRRLDIAYPGHYHLDTTDNTDQYGATLTINYSKLQPQTELPRASVIEH